MTIIDRIKLECKRNNITPASLEKKIGLSNGTISKWNNSKPTAENLYNVAELLHCSIEYLLTGEYKFAELSSDEQAWLDLYRQLSSDSLEYKQECIGFVKGYIARGKPLNL